MRNDKSMIDVAYDVLDKEGTDLPFADIMDRVALELGMSGEEKKARLGALYTDLTLDGRFVAMKEGKWGLRKNHTYDKVHVNSSDIYSSDEDEAENKFEGSEDESVSGEDSDNDQSLDAGYGEDVADDRKRDEFGETSEELAHLVGQDN